MGRSDLNSLEQLLLAHLIGKQEEIDAMVEEVRIKNTLLANNLELYKKIYPEDFVQTPKDLLEQDIFIPKTPQELEAAYDEFSKKGLIPTIEEESDDQAKQLDVIRTYDNLARQMLEASGNPNIGALLQEALAEGKQFDLD